MPEKLDFFEKADVNGAKAREVFAFLKQKLPNDDGTNGIRWNFSTYRILARREENMVCLKCMSNHFFLLLLLAAWTDKFLVDHQGEPYKRFGPTTEPNAMVEDIEELLARKNGKAPSSEKE